MSLNHDDCGDDLPPLAKGKIAKRRVARTLAMQALYQWSIAEQSMAAIEAQFRVDNNFDGVDGPYFHDILHGVASQKADLTDKLVPYLDRAVEELDPVELAILRLAAWELSSRVDVPYKVVINEAVELAKVFGATDGHKFVNGVLDKLAPHLRGPEVRAERLGKQ